jgi:chemotaxis protein CheD
VRRVAIIQGEHAVTGEPGVLITTLLGSCIAVCLHDGHARLGGMNHFLLGEPRPGHKPTPADLQRYGVHAMELLINAMMARGAARDRLRAHVYGGANIVAGLGSIGSQNAAFARRFLETEGIDIGRFDVGGVHARRIEFMGHEGRTRSIAVADQPPPPLPVARAAPPAGGDLELF